MAQMFFSRFYLHDTCFIFERYCIGQFCHFMWEGVVLVALSDVDDSQVDILQEAELSVKWRILSDYNTLDCA